MTSCTTKWPVYNDAHWLSYFLTLWDLLEECCDSDGWLLVELSDSDRVGHCSVCLEASIVAFMLVVGRLPCCMLSCVAARAWVAAALRAALVWAPTVPIRRNPHESLNQSKPYWGVFPSPLKTYQHYSWQNCDYCSQSLDCWSHYNHKILVCWLVRGLSSLVVEMTMMRWWRVSFPHDADVYIFSLQT